MEKIVLSLLTITISGCVSVTSVSVSSFDGGPTTPIDFLDYSVDVLHLTSPEFKINDHLKDKCPSGNITGVQTVITMREFVIIQLYEAQAKGYCKK